MEVLPEMQLREKLAELEHIQWEHWSKTLGKELVEIYYILKIANVDDIPLERKEELVKQAIDKINSRLNKWKTNWKHYSELPEETKEFDREWADKVLRIVNKKFS